MNRRQLLASTAATALISGPVSARFYGAVPTPVAPAGAVTTFQVKNTSGGSLATPRISIAQPLAPGDVPSGSHLELRANDGVTVITSQQDQESTWLQDGSYKVAAISFVSPDTFSTNQIITYQLWSASGAPTRTPIATLANVAANSDIKAHFTGQTLSTDVFEVGVNDIITNGTNWPWGANPMRGWEVVRVGPVCCEWRFWSYLRRTSDDAFHKWLKGWVYVRAWGSAGPYEIAWGVRAPNIVTTHGTVGGASNDTNVFDTVLLDGGTTLQAWGGSADSRVLGVSSTLFNTTTKTVNMPTNTIFGHFSSTGGTPGGVPITFSGTVGTGIDTSAVYWAVPYSLGNSTLTAFGITRSDATSIYYINPGDSAWAALHAYSVGERVTNGGNIIYRCITAGTSAASGGPTGNGTNITDGTAHWTCVIAAFTTQGSGTITMTPHCQCFPFTGQIYLDQNPHRLWSGATRPDYEMAHDLTYLTTQSRALPPYLVTGVSPTADATLYKASPGNQYFQWDINSGGDPVGDDRIGWMMGTEAKILYLPFDVTQHQNTRVIALSFAEEHCYIEDEAVGKVPIMNNGHLRNGTTYTNLGICRPTQRSGVFYANNTPNWLPPGSDGIIERYSVFVDSSHGPMPGYLSYLKTGDDLYREYMLNISNMNMANQAFWLRLGIGSITYERLMCDPDQQQRGVGWGTRWLGNCRYLMPATDPLIQYWSDLHAEEGLFMDAWWQNVDSVSNPLGVPPSLVGPPAVKLPFGFYGLPELSTNVGWHSDISCLCLAVEAWRNEVPGYASFLNNHLYKQILGRVDDAGALAGGCMFCAPVRYMALWANYPSTDNADLPADWQGAWANVSFYYNSIVGATGYMPTPWTTCPAGMAIGGGTGEPLNSAPNTLANFNIACQAMFTIVNPAGHGAALYAQARAIQYALSPPLSFDADPTCAPGKLGDGVCQPAVRIGHFSVARTATFAGKSACSGPRRRGRTC